MFSREHNKKSADKAPDKPTDKHEKESTEPRKRSNAMQTFLESVSQLSDILQEFTDLIPVPGLNPALKTLSTIIKAIQDARDNKEVLEDDMLPRIERIRDQIITPLIDKGDAAEGVAKIVGSRLETSLNKIGKKVKEMSEQGLVTRFICHKMNKDDIQKFGKQLDGILSEFTLEKINQLAATGQEQLKIAKETQAIILEKDQRDLIDNLPHVAAAYDSRTIGDKPVCAPNTQEFILDEIENWAVGSDEQRVYWLCGLAGTGKSTICRTIAARLDSDSRSLLGASYFFSRDDTNVASADSLFPTLAYQLSLYNPGFGRAVAEVLSQKRDVATKTLVSQCQALFSKPLETTELNCLSPTIIVIDAVDECSLGTDTAARLLSPLVDAIRSSRTPIKLLISSRPDPEIVELFDSLEPKGVYKSLNMHEIDVQNDIRMYLQSQFDEMQRLKPKLSHNWITAKDIDKLVAYAVPLFAVAAIMVNFAKKPRKDPRQQVKILLDQSSSAKHLPYSNLDSLYLQALTSAYPDGDDDDDRKCLKLLLSTIVSLQVPMSLSTLAAFCSIDDVDSVVICLQSISSVLIVPESIDGTVRIFHTSFRDFITSASRCTNAFYYVQEDEAQKFLALRCLHILNTELRPDICGLGAAPYANADIPDLDERLALCLPQHIRYSCSYVSADVIASKDNGGSIARTVETFSSGKLLMWIEVLGLLQQVDVLLSSLLSIGEWYNKHADSKPRVRNILSDAFRFVSNFREAIETSTGDIYGPLLAIMPPCDMKATYLDFPSAYCVRGLPIVDRDWGSCRWAVRLDSLFQSEFVGLGFSPNGKFLAVAHTYGYRERYGVWKTDSGVVAKYDGPLPSSNSSSALRFRREKLPVAFSSDNAYLACADTRDMKVWIYPLATSEGPRALRVDTGDKMDKILFIAYITGGDKSLLVVTRSGHINAWSANAVVGDAPRRIYTPTSMGDRITLAAVSEDGCKLAIVRSGTILDMWDISSGRHISEGILRLEYEPFDHRVDATDDKRQQEMSQMLFLADGNHLAVWYRTSVGFREQNTMEILEVKTGRCLRSVHKEDVSLSLTCMASAGGRLALLYRSMVGGSEIHVYAENYVLYTVLSTPDELHRAGDSINMVSTIAFSPDRLVVAVGSADLVSVHDVNSLKEKHVEASRSCGSYLSYGTDGILYDVKVARMREQADVTVHTKGPHNDCNTTYSLRKQDYMDLFEHRYSLEGPFLIERDERSLLMTDLRTRQPTFGFSIKGSRGKAIGTDISVFADGRWMTIYLGSRYGSEREDDDEVWLHDLDNGAFVAMPWTSGRLGFAGIQLAADGRSFLAVTDKTFSLSHNVTSYVVWEMHPSNPLQATKKGNWGFEKRICRMRVSHEQTSSSRALAERSGRDPELVERSPSAREKRHSSRDTAKLQMRSLGEDNLREVSLLGSDIQKKQPNFSLGSDDYIWDVIDVEDLSIKSYTVVRTSFLHSTPAKTSPRFLFVHPNRIEIQVGEVKRRLCWIPPKWSPKNWAWEASSWSGSELAFCTNDGELIRINTDELEESLYGSRLEWS